MKISLAKSAGFCFGVKRAIEIALKTAAGKNQVCMLGDIVHNEEVVKQVSHAGIKRIKKLTPTKNKILLIRAHGCSQSILRKAKHLGYKIVDATCPMVKEIHKIAKKMEQAGFQIIVIGDKKHDEVRGICGQLKKKAIVIDSLENIPLKKLRQIKKGGVVVQSTQNLDKVLKILEVLKKYIPEIKFYNTVCHATRIRQEEIKKMPHQNDIMLIIGSKASANTRRLFEISREINPRTYWITEAGALKKEWLKRVKNVGITAGASTPNITIKKVIKKIKKIA
jgi:4-hydroxy-3-methylbut-2-enyl diphosphate reductase